MTLDIDPKRVREFTRKLQEAYDDESVLRVICRLHDLDEIGKDQEHNFDFYQIGRRTQFPLDVVETGINRTNADTIAREIANGEKRFLLNRLEQAAKKSQLDSTEIENELTVRDLTAALREASGADRILLPIVDEYWDAIHKWDEFEYEETPNKAEGRIKVGTAELGVHWLPAELGIEDIFLIDSDAINVVQKRLGESDLPNGITSTSEYDDWIDSHPFMIHFGDEVIYDEEDEDFPEKVDLVYRVVISEPQLGQQSVAHRLVSPPELKNDLEEKN